MYNFLNTTPKIDYPDQFNMFCQQFPCKSWRGDVGCVGRGSILASTELVADDRNRGVVSSGVGGTMC